MVGLPPIDMQQFGSHEEDVILSFEDAFLPPRSWSFAGRIPFTDQQPNEKQ
ncbi:hypothetical protein DVH05_012537 [Phytophthora capsici]|nr:hypothetical protein DVH05_012537 [Phytophthora capsici]